MLAYTRMVPDNGKQNVCLRQKVKGAIRSSSQSSNTDPVRSQPWFRRAVFNVPAGAMDRGLAEFAWWLGLLDLRSEETPSGGKFVRFSACCRLFRWRLPPPQSPTIILYSRVP